MDKRMKVFLMLLQYMSNKIILDLFQLFVILNRPKIRALWAITSVVGQIFVQMFGKYTARAICANFWIQLKQINKQKKKIREIQISDCMSTTKRSLNKVTRSDGREFKNDSQMGWIYLCCIVFHSLGVRWDWYFGAPV